MNAPVTNTAAPDRRSRWRGWLRRIGQLAAIGLIAIIFFLMVILFLNYRDRRILADAIAEADRLDPGWRLVEILAKRSQIPDDENGALIIAALCESDKPYDDWGMRNAGYNDHVLRSLTPCERLPVAKATILRAAMTSVEWDRHQARKLANLPRGRFRIDWRGNPAFTIVPFQHMRLVANLLSYDARLLAEDSDIDGALQSTRAAINLSRYSHDEPSPLNYLAQISCMDAALTSLERTLGQGEAEDPALAAVQALLEDDDREPHLLHCLRGERATNDHWFAMVDDGRISMEQYFATAALNKSANKSSLPQWLQELRDRLLPHHGLSSLPVERAALLRYLTRTVEIAKLPDDEQWPAILEHSATVKDQLLMTRIFAPAGTGKIFEAHLTHRARVRTAITAVAAERFRMRHGRWPKALDELIPDLLPCAPRDPFASAPLQCLQLPDGFSVSSVGPNRNDDGGDLDSNHPGTPGLDTGFRLWNPDKRRQPPAKAEEKKP